TVTGGSEAVSLTQKWQISVIFAGMVTALVVVLATLPEGLGFSGSAHIAGALGRLHAVDVSVDPSRRYTLWTGLFGGLFLSLSYFGTAQSQVQRYLGGGSLRDDPPARATMVEANRRTDAVRSDAKAALRAADPRAKTKDSDYVFITFILTELPHGAVGLLLAVIFAAAFGSLAAELNALGTTTTIDYWRHFRPLAAADERRNMRVAKRFTALWGIVAVSFALFA